MIQTSIIIPTLNEENYISSCIDSIIASDIEKSTIEVLVVDGKSSDKTIEIVKDYIKKYPFIKLFVNEKKIIPTAMNIGIKHSKGEYIIRVDAHSVYPKNYFTNLLKYAKSLDADNVGGICITDVKNKTAKTESIKVVMSHKFGVGGGDYRSEIKEPKISNTVPFGCFKKEALLRSGFFDERLQRGEDLEINKRLIDSGGKVYLVPEVFFTYFAKEKLVDLAKKSFSTGKWVVLTAYFTKAFKALHLRHFAPLVLVLSWFIPLFFCSIDSIFCIISLLSFISYIVAIVFLSARLKKRNNSFFYLVATFITLHISFGIGSVFGISEALINYLRGNK